MKTSRMAYPLTVLGVVWLCAGLSAQGGDPLHTLAWLTGSWHGELRGIATEEHWMAPRAGSMIGMHRDVRDGKTVGFEFARIEVRDGTPVYLASPGGAPPTAFTAVEVGDRRVVFENPAHDFPQRIIYWRDGDMLRARVEGRQGEAVISEEWVWRPGSLLGPR